MSLAQEEIVAALKTVRDPESNRDLISCGCLKDLSTDGQTVALTVELPSAQHRDAIEGEIIRVLRAIGARDVKLTLRTIQDARQQSPLPQVKNVVAVGAGKGGVGKSTIALNLAVGLQRTGAKVGLLDGDIYGPSMPTMLGVRGVQPTARGSRILPHHVHGIHAITIGSLVPSDAPLIWRGPKAHGAFKQLLLDNVEWPELDYLVVDLPPGTGDVPLSLCQLLPVTGAVVVATPQQVALDDAVRAVRMFQQLGAPILGLVENMSYFVAPDGSEHDIFGRGGTDKAAKELNLPFLGDLPMFTELRLNSDQGRPHANFEGALLLRKSLEAIVQRLIEEVDKRNAQAGPTLEIT